MKLQRQMPTVWFAIALAVIGLVMSACGSAGGGGAEAPAAPAKKPFVAPEWDSTEYRSEDGAFFLHYPSEFQEQPAQGPGALLSVASPSMVPRVDVTRIDAAGSGSIEEIGAGMEANMAQLGGGEAKIASSEMVTLRDGVTEAMRYNLDWTFQGFPLDSVILVVPTADYHVSVLVTGMDGADMAELEDIAFTLTVP